VNVAGVELFGDALVTVDGLLRLYIGDPYSPSGVLELSGAAAPAEFAGNLAVSGEDASGHGLLIAVGCGLEPAGRFCGPTAEANVTARIRPGSDLLFQELRVVTDAGIESWSLRLDRWEDWYDYPANVSSYAHGFEETLAEFVVSGDTFVNVDANGRLFLQSAHSGCTGNGTMRPHLDGAFDVYDVVLSLANCAEPFAYLNREFEGLASSTPSNYWGYDVVVRVWLSTPNGAPDPAAIVMLGY